MPIMNDTSSGGRIRGRTMLVVEGFHERDVLFKSIFYGFPELKISMDDVVVYETNIYSLVKDIDEEYGDDWDDADIDIPFVYSKHKGLEGDANILRKRDFTNIFLVFDYERQDTYFSEDSIARMQEHFNDAADNGKLFLNYPMVESYMEADVNGKMDELHPYDESFRDRRVTVNECLGAEYKNRVKHKELKDTLKFGADIGGILVKHKLPELPESCLGRLLEQRNADESGIGAIIGEYFEGDARGACCHIAAKLKRLCPEGMSYRERLREILRSLMYNNICKASYVQNGVFDVAISDAAEVFLSLENGRILEKQNECSRESSGFVHVLNTGVLIAADYNSKLIYI